VDKVQQRLNGWKAQQENSLLLCQPYRLEAKRNQSKRGAKLRASLEIGYGGERLSCGSNCEHLSFSLSVHSLLACRFRHISLS
jgi:hypothetical protein